MDTSVRMLNSQKLPAWYALALQGTLMQAWAPWLTEQTVQLHCWFLSAMVPYWALYGIFFRTVVMRLTTVRRALGVLLLLALPPWIQFIFPAATSNQWSYGEYYAAHNTGRLDPPFPSLLVIFLKFHPFCYVQPAC